MKHKDYLAHKLKIDPEFKKIYDRSEAVESLIIEIIGRELTEEECDKLYEALFKE